MTPPGQRYQFTRTAPSSFNSLVPLLSVQLIGKITIHEEFLIDTGASVNIMPYTMGLQLGSDWKKAFPIGPLSGAFANVQAKALTIDAVVAPFPLVRLAFAWADTDSVRPILGHVNFFDLFDICFFRSRREFEVRPKH